MLLRIHAYAKSKEIPTEDHLVDEYLCHPAELTKDGELSDKDLVYLALGLIKFQFHYDTHAKSCFKITSRTPSGLICRYLFPKLARLLQTYIDVLNGKIVSHRPIGCEYYNLCCLVWTRLSKNNTDIQFLINGSTRRSTAYTTKYSFKAQRPETALAMKIGLVGKAFTNSLNAADAETITPLEQGRRTINKALYQFTQPQELHLSMAAYVLLNDGPFFYTHEPVFVNLKHICACFYDGPVTAEILEDDRDPNEEYLDTDDDGSAKDVNEESDTEEEADSSDEEETAAQVREDYARRVKSSVVESDNDVDESPGYVNITVSKYALSNRDERSSKQEKRSSDDCAAVADKDADKEDRHEADDYLEDLCLLTDYWHRPLYMQNLSFIYVKEHFHIVRNSPPPKQDMAMVGDHPRKGNLYWLRNKHHERRCAVFVGGKGGTLPNLAKRSLTEEEREFYYKAMLIMFKPHDYTTKKILGSHSCYQEAYYAFLDSEADLPATIEARLQEDLLANYYHNEAEACTNPSESEEVLVFKDHPFADPDNDPRKRGADACGGWHRHGNEDGETIVRMAMMEEGMDEAAMDAIVNLKPSISVLPDEIMQVCNVTTTYHPTISVPKHDTDLPTFATYDQYKKELVDPRSGRPEHFNGSSAFASWAEQPDVKIKTMTEYFEPVPWTNPKQAKLDCSPDAINVAVKALPRFASIKDISTALRLNFWQHAAYETYARHLMYLFMLDVRDEDPIFRTWICQKR